MIDFQSLNIKPLSDIPIVNMIICDDYTYAN